MKTFRPTKDVCDFLGKLQSEKIFNQLWRKILNLLNDPRPNDSIKIGESKGSDVYRSDSGEYRLIYQYDLQNFFLMLIGKRNDDEIYKKYVRKL